jgi:hypothetical protein
MALDVARRERERTLVGVDRRDAEPAQEVRARGVQEVVVVEALDRVREGEPFRRPVSHRHCNGAIQLDDRGRREVEEAAVEECDLAPVRLLLRVEGGDRSLQLLRPRHPQHERALERQAALRDLVVVPQRAVLILE